MHRCGFAKPVAKDLNSSSLSDLPGSPDEDGYPADPVNQYDLDGQAWKCKSNCGLVGNDSKCTGYVWGAGSGKTESDAVKSAKKDLSSKAPRGCRTKHCRAVDCTMGLRVRSAPAC